MGIPYLFSNFCCDLWFSRNIEYTTATFFQAHTARKSVGKWCPIIIR